MIADDDRGVPITVKVQDNRKRSTDSAGSEEDVASASAAASPAEPSEEFEGAASSAPRPASARDDRPDVAERDYLDDLRRLQAEFENYRKRMMKEQSSIAERASGRLVERLLPVLDNFERAVAHGEGGAGVELVYKELRRSLEQEGLEEIAAEGQPFDPTVHEAVEHIDDPTLTEPLCRVVYRRGYRLKGRLLRPAMVAVVGPPPGAASGTGDGGVEQTPSSKSAEG